MTSISPFVIDKTLESVAGAPKSVKKLLSEDLLVEVEKPAHAQNLLAMTLCFNHPCKCIAHSSLNSPIVVIHCPDLAGVSEMEIVQELTAQHITAARRIKRKLGKEIHTNAIIFTFGIPFLPSFINVGYLRTKITTYIPNPLQYYNCSKFEHNEKTCNANHICPKCSLEHDTCSPSLCCVNCSEPHSAKSRDCKAWEVEKEVLHVKFTQGRGFPEARQIANAKFISSSLTATYSSFTKSNTNKSIKCIDASTQTDSVSVPDVLEEKPKVAAKPAHAQTPLTQKAAAKPTLPPVVQNVPKYSSTPSSKQKVMSNSKLT
ncbi:uncharacterized protein LOC128548777 [Mercenaria mercenaria]|uniref:uncharacterized protein LOC128548777 n=1 Tax=Mercenaria mercenaria TaxID=6596 RepID=UPI00234F52A0|nr:uncharacterized protein LOC128548777 [Mercenaria mercenaria]